MLPSSATLRLSRVTGTLALALALVLGACGTGAPDPPQLAFWNSIRALCGQTFDGTAIEVSALDSAIVGQNLKLDVWQCYHDEMRLAFHVGDDRSRVWVLSRAENVLRVRHEVHDEDGSATAASGYGGIATPTGTATRQEFAPDGATTTQFPSAAGSLWDLEVLPHERLTYRYSAGSGGVLFRVDFDLSRHTGRPPPPWGFTRQSRPDS